MRRSANHSRTFKRSSFQEIQETAEPVVDRKVEREPNAPIEPVYKIEQQHNQYLRPSREFRVRLGPWAA